jgi:hypothetical protein
MADVTVASDDGGTVLGGHTSESNAASEGCHLIAQLQVIMSDLQTSMPVGDDILPGQKIVCLRDRDDNFNKLNLGGCSSSGCSAIEGDLRLLVP